MGEVTKHVIKESVTVPDDQGGRRFDQIAAACFPEFSRARLQEWIREGFLVVDGDARKPKEKLYGGEQLSLSVEVQPEGQWAAENIPLDVVYQDNHIMVINKPAGLVVHPAAGNYTGTLLNALLYHYPDNAALPRAGIVHRLDKDTTGLMVVARSLAAHTDLVAQLQDRTVHREYEAVVRGVMTGGGVVDAPIGRHPQNRLKMAVVRGGKPSVTHYRVVKRYKAHTHIRLNLQTGRTHQIRVHMSHQHFPLVGDDLYGGGLKLPKSCPAALEAVLRAFRRQALHARQLGLIHPATGEYMEWEVPLTDDFQMLLDSLAANEPLSD
ncbi:23S rRNA pseudouridine(1911/1915/1917) synthase RluD [Endozoicomonas sp. GU-1]|uniref:23S rRNA pseudouridine(1911/1915/1917) synthase RluD n=1 Tax=Endozoicomonas sp. GU-1 TaxID=3009078 RepID=UPI0022B52103|nr:23S rRNA pseudouridine(1911/1915/1917) synthase RluD [Endozoicomonas sp. GU-1]WBA80215.1 23S rRNA pseudouridine(1911/1915/1917) synthase RluD [Endozoicomonas sp. GU-1]WBA87791.1 23S rRNA pseudouridine(1911/1915/1917) synthase RluD [Endozoicomonas sp. GU-1]